MPDIAGLDLETDRQMIAQLRAEFEAFLAQGGGVLPASLHKGLVGGHLELPHTWFTYEGAGAMYVSRRVR